MYILLQWKYSRNICSEVKTAMIRFLPVLVTKGKILPFFGLIHNRSNPHVDLRVRMAVLRRDPVWYAVRCCFFVQGEAWVAPVHVPRVVIWTIHDPDAGPRFQNSSQVISYQNKSLRCVLLLLNCLLALAEPKDVMPHTSTCEREDRCLALIFKLSCLTISAQSNIAHTSSCSTVRTS